MTLFHAASRDALAAAELKLLDVRVVAPAKAKSARDLGRDGSATSCSPSCGCSTARPGLRRALGDSRRRRERAHEPAAPACCPARCTTKTLEVLDDLVRSRWSTPRELVDGIDELGRTALLVHAERDGRLDAVEDELFRFGRIVAGDARAGAGAVRPDRAERGQGGSWSRALLGHKADEVTVSLVDAAGDHATRPAAGRTGSASWPSRPPSGVSGPSPTWSPPVALTEQQQERLADTLTRIYGRPIALHIEVDPDIQGGLVDQGRRRGHRRQRDRPDRRAAQPPRRLSGIHGPLTQKYKTVGAGNDMAELTISSDEIRSAIDNYVSSYSPDVSREEVGLVVDTGDGIAHVEGLPSAMANELLEFPGGVLGVALNLEPRQIGAVILGDFETDRGGPGGQADRPDPLGPGRRRVPRPRGRTRWASPSTASARSTPTRRRALELQAAPWSSASR